MVAERMQPPAWAIDTGGPFLAAVWVETAGSPKVPGKPVAPGLRSLTPVRPQHLAMAVLLMLQTQNDTTPALTFDAFEARSRSLYAPCVRFAAAITRGPRNTRFRGGGWPFRGQDFFSCGVSLQGFGYVIGIFLLAQALPGAHHIHLVVEAATTRSLSAGLRSFTIRIAKRLNRLLLRRGRVFADRWHFRALTTPRAVRHVLVYVLANAKKHGADRGFSIDPCSSAAEFSGFREPLPRAPPKPSVSLPRTWLLASGWKRHGLISIHEQPRG